MRVHNDNGQCQCSSKSFLHNVGSNNCRPSETKFCARCLAAECDYDQRREVAGWMGGRPPWAVAAPTTLPSWGSAGPPAASRCCRSRNPWRRSRLLLRAAVRAWKSAWRRPVPGAWCLVCRSDGLHVCTSTSTSSSLVSRARVTFGMMSTNFPSPQSSFGSH